MDAGDEKRGIGNVIPWHGSALDYYPRLATAPRRCPAVILYSLVSIAFFLPTARRVPGNYVTNQDPVRHLFYAIPDLSQHVGLALRSLFTAPFFNHNAVQLVYVILLLLLFGIPFEYHEGWWRTVLIFFATSFVGAVSAGLLLHFIYPNILASQFLEQDWERSWSGGSAGCFGIMGATAARAPVPWPMLLLVVAWEATVVAVYLREYTPAFHLSALVAGFLMARYVIRPPAR